MSPPHPVQISLPASLDRAVLNRFRCVERAPKAPPPPPPQSQYIVVAKHTQATTKSGIFISIAASITTSARHQRRQHHLSTPQRTSPHQNRRQQHETKSRKKVFTTQQRQPGQRLPSMLSTAAFASASISNSMNPNPRWVFATWSFGRLTFRKFNTASRNAPASARSFVHRQVSNFIMISAQGNSHILWNANAFSRYVCTK